MKDPIDNKLLRSYLGITPAAGLETENQIKEALQSLVLYALSLTDFFSKAAFLGGTALRIGYDLERFSEDLDFSLLESDPDFDLGQYLKRIEEELQSMGLNVSLEEKRKKQKTSIRSGFLKANEREMVLTFYPDSPLFSKIQRNAAIRIKLEIDLNPPLGAETENKLLYYPQLHRICFLKKSSLFAGKINAVLTHPYTNIPKGRDLFDFAYYVQTRTPVNLTMLKNALCQAGKWDQNDELDIDTVKSLLKTKFREMNFEAARADVLPFIHEDHNILKFWNSDVFIELADSLRADYSYRS